MNRQEKQRFGALDALRGLAALTVAVFHYFNEWAGYLMVDFFFVLSGFILTHNYLYGESRVGFGSFIEHRIARLYPLHVFTLVTFTAAFFALHGNLPAYPDGTVFTLLQQLTLTNNVGLSPSGATWNFVAWSVSVEFWVNVAFILLVTRSTRSSVLILVSASCFLLLFEHERMLDTFRFNYFGFANSGLIRGMASFLLGVLAYRLYLARRDRPRTKTLDRWLEPVAIGGILFVLFARESKASALDFLAPLAFMLTVVVFANESGWLSSRLRSISHLGSISYSVYMNQTTVLELVSLFGKHRWPDATDAQAFPLYLGALLAYSQATYALVEQPSRKWLRDSLPRWAGRLGRRAA